MRRISNSVGMRGEGVRGEKVRGDFACRVNFRLPIADCGLQTANCKLRTADCKLQTVYSHTPYTLLLPLLALHLLLSGCYEPQEGCLDLEAVNYDFSADENNTEDCNYPELRLQFNHRFVGADTTYNFRFDSTYLDSEGNPFTFDDLRFYISNVRLLGANGTSYGVEEELTIFIPEEGDTTEVLVEDNFAIVSPSNSQTLSMGTMRETYAVSGIRFAVGVEGLANKGVPSRLASSHPLSLRDSSLYFSQDSGYVFNSISLFRYTTAADTIPELLRIGTNPYLQIVELPLAEEKPQGFHYKVVLNIDYTQWFTGINVREDTEEVLIEKIVSNITESFTVIEVELEGD